MKAKCYNCQFSVKANPEDKGQLTLYKCVLDGKICGWADYCHRFAEKVAGASASRYRALNLKGEKVMGVSTQGTFTSVSELKKCITERGLDKGENLRVEREQDGKWVYIQDVTIH